MSEAHPSEYRGPLYSQGTVLITGGGAGLAVAVAFAATGATVLCVDRDQQVAEGSVAELVSAEFQAHAFACAVSGEGSVAALSTAVKDKSLVFGVAGVFDRYAPSYEFALDLWNTLIGVNHRPVPHLPSCNRGWYDLPHIDGAGSVTDAATLRTPVRRMGTAGEVAGLAVYLTSSAADFIRGTVLPVDGGWTAI